MCEWVCRCGCSSGSGRVEVVVVVAFFIVLIDCVCNTIFTCLLLDARFGQRFGEIENLVAIKVRKRIRDRNENILKKRQISCGTNVRIQLIFFSFFWLNVVVLFMLNRKLKVSSIL